MNQLATPEPGPRWEPGRAWPGAHGSQDEGGLPLSLADLRTMLWRQRKVLGLIVLAALAVGLAVTLLMTPRFRAEATVRIDNEAVKILEGQDLDPVVTVGDTNRYLNTQKSIVESRNLAVTVADSLKLDANDSFIDAMGGKLARADLAPAERQATRRAETIALLQRNVAMAVAPDNRIGTISFTSRDPALAARIANAYAETYIAHNVKARYDTNAYARRVLTEQVQQTRAQLQQTELRAIDYARRNRLIDTGEVQASGGGEDAGPAAPARSIKAANLVQLNQAYVAARAERIAAEARWRAAQGSAGYEIPDGTRNTAVQTILTRRAETGARLAELRARYQDGHPEVIEKAEELAALDRQLAAAGRTVKAALEADYRAALANERQLAAAADQLAGETLGEQDRRVQLNLIARDAETQRRQLNDLLTRLNQINAAADVTANNISLLDPAQAPARPVSPDLPKNMLLALGAGLALALAAAFIREALDDTLRSPDDAERKLGLPLMGTTPYVADVTLRDLEERQGELSEAYYSIRATVDYASAGVTNKVFLITSSQPSEGKSTTAIAMARDFAQIGRRVLLIDADLRNPSLHTTLGLPRERGLMDVLAGQAKLSKCVIDADVDGLHLLPLGQIPPNPVQLLSSSLIPDFLARAREKYDVILLDSAPIMGLADAPMLSRMVDYVLLIVEANRAHFGQAKSAVRRLQDAGANILGIVMTKFSFRHAGYTYDYHYSYYSYRDRKAREAQDA